MPKHEKERLDQYSQVKNRVYCNISPRIHHVGPFLIFLTANILAALYVAIHDCDETFNYWEPTHYISHGYGLQTWEYSPDFAIRSWLYVVLHAAIGILRKLLPNYTKVAEFYFIRYVLALICSLCQSVMFLAIKNTLNIRIAIVFLVSMIFSPGMYHASVSFLPSSFSMYTTILGMSAFMDIERKKKTIFHGIIWFSFGGIIGWPFSLVLAAPFLLEEIFLAFKMNGDAFTLLIWQFRQAILASLFILSGEILISGLFYRRLVIVPLNIVLYNVLSGPGPNLYGTESWHFYIRNLFLNFNIWFLLSIISLPLYVLQKATFRDNQSTEKTIRGITLLSPFYLWLIIFSFQPHKEERFMYPAYPSLILNAAISLHLLLSAFGNLASKRYLGKLPGWIKLSLAVSILLASMILGIARIYGIVTAYSAPLYIYEPLSNKGSNDNVVCFGKEWYRFPSSYHLPKNMHAKFIKSEFRGLLPGEFSEIDVENGFRSGTWMIPSGMNDQNLEDVGKYIEINACDFLVDTYYHLGNEPSPLESNYILDTANWEIIHCVPFLDASKTSLLGRVIWVPEIQNFLPLRWRSVWSSKVNMRKWGKHCLLKRRAKN
ncbi:Alpha-1,2-mannosyltransferase alg9 [Erysiphe neolycopersici]|uniref:Mannosyltransferase n=1 Tax=Erysiphe neolycopersici TaxID=212602 RepID=A0A420I5T4_9PEZI|nr:Alpha-1,2-mannosyltransferase alg9 [Erysiphe neolycopersici]